MYSISSNIGKNYQKKKEFSKKKMLILKTEPRILKANTAKLHVHSIDK